MTRRVLLSLVSLSWVIGCTSARGNFPSPSPLPQGTSEPGTPVAGKEDRGRLWKITPTPEVDTYRSTLKTTIAERSTKENRQEGFTTTADYTLRIIRSSNSTEISGNVTDFRIEPDQIEQTLPSSLSVLPLSFEGNISDNRISLRVSNANRSAAISPCGDSSHTILSIISREIIIVPHEIMADQGWQDSTLSSVCSGSLPVLVSLISNYRITGETIVNGIPALKLERTDRLVTSGEGSQGQHQITVNGTGTGKAQIYIDHASGVLLTLIATNQVELSIKSSGKIQTFTQRSEENVVRTFSQ